MSENKRKQCVFLDRDGVIVESVAGYLTSVKDVRFIPGAAGAIKALNLLGYIVIIVTNQSCINRNIITREEAINLHTYIENSLCDEGAIINASFMCPHDPEEACLCRKPLTLFVDWAERLYDLDVPGSFMIGDQETDMIFATRAGMTPILVKTGNRPVENPKKNWIVVDNIVEAVHIIEKLVKK